MAISSTKSDRVASRAFATIRFAGDLLDPAALTSLLGRHPSRGYRQGEVFRSGPRSPEQIGKTGVWFLSTHKLRLEGDLVAHTTYVAGLLADLPETPLVDARFRAIRDMIERECLGVSASCFWSGSADERAPAVPPLFTELISHLHGSVEIAFDHDRREPVDALETA